MNCGCNQTPTSPPSTAAPNVYFTWGVPYRREGDLVEPYAQWTLAESDLYVRFEYVFRDTFEYDTGGQYGNAKIEVSASEDGSSPTVAASDSFHFIPFTSDNQITATADAIVKKGLYYRIAATCPGTLEDLVATDHTLYEYSSLTLTPCVTPISLAPVTTSCGCSPCDPCAPTSRCNTPPPMPVIVVPGVNATLPPCTGPNTFEPVAGFTLPAEEANAPLQVCNPKAYPIGQCVFLSDGTNSVTLRVLSHNLTNRTIQLENYGAPGAPTAGTVFTSASVISPIGPCPATAEQVCDRAGWALGEAFTPQAATVDTTMHVEPCIAVTVGQKLFVKALGWFEVKSIDGVTESGTELTVWTSALLPGVVAGTTTAASGGYVIADEPQVFTPTTGAVSMIAEHDVDIGALAGAGSVSANSEPLVLPWAANLMIAPNVSANSLSATAGIRFDYGIWYSSDAGATWTDTTAHCTSWGGEPHEPQTVPFTLSLPAGTYLFRFRMDTSGAYTYPVVAYTNIHILAVRQTAVVS